ncbi:MAG: PEGA domain-containing protein [Vicinamibacterales bacterium]
MTLKVAAGVLFLAAIAGAAMVGKLKWDDFIASRRIGSATFASVPSGAQVFVDGQPVGTTPVHGELPVGRHDVELRLKGQKRGQPIEIVHGEDLPVAIDWRAKPTGSLQISSSPSGAKVSVDGKPRGVTPLSLRDLVVGTHTVNFDSSQGSVKRQVTISEGKTETLSESIFSGWLHVSAPMEVTLSEGARALQLDSSNRVFLRPGIHEITAQNKELGFSLTQTVEILPGATADLDIDTPDSSITVKGPEGAAVYIDNERVGDIPVVNHQVKIGSRDVRVVDRSGAAYHITVNVTKAPAQVNVDFSKP